jgi:hypothetical protein
MHSKGLWLLRSGGARAKKPSVAGLSSVVQMPISPSPRPESSRAESQCFHLRRFVRVHWALENQSRPEGTATYQPGIWCRRKRPRGHQRIHNQNRVSIHRPSGRSQKTRAAAPRITSFTIGAIIPALCRWCHDQTDAPYERGRLVVTVLCAGQFTFEVVCRGPDNSPARVPPFAHVGKTVSRPG